MEKGDLNRLLGKLGRLHWRRSHAEFIKQGITQGEPRILRYLKSHEGCIQRELCDNCHLEPASVTNILAKMEHEGLIERHYEPGSRRSLQVFLTQKGHECLLYVEHVHQILEDECFSGFIPAEKELAASFFQRICNNMLKAEEQIAK